MLTGSPDAASRVKHVFAFLGKQPSILFTKFSHQMFNYWPVNSRQLIRLAQLFLNLSQSSSNRDRILGDCLEGNGANEMVTKIGDDDQRWAICVRQTVKCFTERLIPLKGYQIVVST